MSAQVARPRTREKSFRSLRARALSCWVACILACSFSGACALPAQEIVLFYPPRAPLDEGLPDPALSPELPPIEVAAVRDARGESLRVGLRRGWFGMTYGTVAARNAVDEWVAGAARFELARAGWIVAQPASVPSNASPSDGVALELVLRSAESAADSEHPARLEVDARLRWNGRLLLAQRLRGSAPSHSRAGVRLDPAESLAMALADVLQPLSRRCAALALAERRPPARP